MTARSLCHGRRTLATVLVCTAVGSGAYVARMSGQALPPTPTPAESFTQTVLPVLSKNCFTCHSDRLPTGGLSLEVFRDSSLALQRPEAWAKVLDKLKAGAMPPAPMAPLSPADRAAVMGWIEKNMGAGRPRGGGERRSWPRHRAPVESH